MGFLDRLAGTTPKQQQEEEKAAQPQQQQQASTSRSSSEVLHDLSPNAGSFPVGAAGSQARLYDPYEGISTAVGGRKAAFQLPEGPEFVFQEEAAARRRGWGENMQFYTGVGYLGGGATGFAIGGFRYLQQPAPEAALSSLKLKANRLINMSGSLGRRFACASGILGIYFATFESWVFMTADGRLPDAACTAAAGFATAALFRSPRGPKPAAVAGAVGALAAASLHAARQKWPSL